MEMKELKDKLDTLAKNLKGIPELESEIKGAKDAASDAKEKIEKISLKNAELVDEVKELRDAKKSMSDRMDEMELKAKENGGGRGGADPMKALLSPLEDNLKSAGLSSTSGKHKTAQYEVDGVGYKHIRSQKDITNVPGSAGPLIDADRRNEILGIQERTPRVVDALDTLPISTDTYEYLRELAQTDNTGSQSAQGDLLGESDYTFEEIVGTIVTIGTTLPASMQILDDVPRLEGFLRTKLTRKLDLEVEDQVLTGDGTGQTLSGLIPNATAYDATEEDVFVPDGSGGTEATDVDRIMIAKQQIMEREYVPTAIMLRPFNWTNIQLTKTTEGAYVFVNPQNDTTPRMWGLPIIATTAMPEGNALIGDFQTAATFYDREMSGVEISTEHSDFFARLMAMMRIYSRCGLAVEYPEAMTNVDTLATSA